MLTTSTSVSAACARITFALRVADVLFASDLCLGNRRPVSPGDRVSRLQGFLGRPANPGGRTGTVCLPLHSSADASGDTYNLLPVYSVTRFSRKIQLIVNL